MDNARLAELNIIYQRQLSDKVKVYIGNEVTPDSDHSQYLALYICRTDKPDMVKLRLSTFRKLVKYIKSLELAEARRLTWQEKVMAKESTVLKDGPSFEMSCGRLRKHKVRDADDSLKESA